MSKPKTLRIVPTTRLLKENPPDGGDPYWHEGVAADVPTAEAEGHIAANYAVEVLKGEVDAGASVEVVPVAADTDPEPAPAEVVTVVAPDPATTPTRTNRRS